MLGDNPFMVSRKALEDATGNDRVARALERLILLAQDELKMGLIYFDGEQSQYLPLSRKLVAGDGIEFDTTTDGELTIKLAGGGDGEFENLTVNNDVLVGNDLTVTGQTIMNGGVVIGQSPSAWTGAIDFTIPITVDGDTFYLPLSTTP